MGGWGSNRWPVWHQKKAVVDDSLILDIGVLRRHGLLHPETAPRDWWTLTARWQGAGRLLTGAWSPSAPTCDAACHTWWTDPVTVTRNASISWLACRPQIFTGVAVGTGSPVPWETGPLAIDASPNCICPRSTVPMGAGDAISYPIVPVRRTRGGSGSGSWGMSARHSNREGGRLVKPTRYDWLLLAEGHLTRRLFEAMLRRIWVLPLPAG